MLLVSDVFSEVSRIMRACDDATVYDRISDAAEILCNKADIDPLLGWVDIVTGGSRYFTLPREVDTVLAVNISGKPSFARNRWAEFHLNGLGTDDTVKCDEFWDDKGGFPLFVDPTNPVRFSVSTTRSEDVSAGELWVYGYDENDRWVTSLVNGSPVDGYKATLYATPTVPNSSVPLFKRVTMVRKTSSKGYFSLWGTAANGTTVLYGEYQPAETLPSFRRIRISKNAEWVRVRYRQKVFRVTKSTDLIPVHSRYALMLMIKALQKYDDDKLEEAAAYEAQAVRLLIEKQQATNPPVGPSFQVSNATRLVSDRNRLL
ncbi:MAG: hypothetical protein EBR82_18975 [Caulobacteraceae bacterium]|nr:hypothetical protein [Caulobacteraceae bacterium]